VVKENLRTYQKDIAENDGVFSSNFIKIFAYKRREDKGTQFETTNNDYFLVLTLI